MDPTVDAGEEQARPDEDQNPASEYGLDSVEIRLGYYSSRFAFAVYPIFLVYTDCPNRTQLGCLC